MCSLWIALVVLLIRCNSVSTDIGSNSRDCDFVIIGAGTAGCLLANRLTEDESVTVCLIEAGGEALPYTQIPLAIPLTYADPFINWNYKLQPQPVAFKGTVNEQPLYPRGRALGGTSAINGLLYIRGNKVDYDIWEEMGATNWSYNDVLPYFKKSEGNRIDDIDPEYHGFTGEQTVERSSYFTALGGTILEAGRILGVPTRDVNGESQRGFTLSPLAERDGYRCSSEKAFLRPIYDRPNFTLLKYTLATKIDIDNHNVARGVFVSSGLFAIQSYVKAKKEVILCAGAINSPQLLQLSGVGPELLLKRFNIPIKSVLPVGENLQDHALISGLYYSVNASTGVNPRKLLESASVGPVPLRGPLTSPFLNAVGFVKTKLETREGDYNDIEISFTQILSLFEGLELKYYLAYGALALGNVFTANVAELHPKTRGTVTIQSTNPKDKPIIDLPFFSDEKDLKVVIEGLKFAKKMIDSPPFQRLNAKPLAEPLLGCEGIPLYSDKYYACMATTLTAPGYHTCCTCRMGSPQDGATVVDSNLRVKGVKQLRVIDASVMPKIISGNTNAPTLMIAEKGADLIKKEHNLR